uniref:Uncharacterized protein n=1 Tax=Ciona savignyi TaxID=51511 RepID=H2YWQ8_CIOSA
MKNAESFFPEHLVASQTVIEQTMANLTNM